MITRDYINGYKFKSWTTSSSQISPHSTNNFITKFTIPSKNTNVADKNVVFTANYMAPNNLKIIDPQTEFIVGDKFTFGPNAQIVVTYPDGSTKIISPTELELTSDPALGEELNEEGEREVTVEYADLTFKYDIEVVAKKYNLIVEINDVTYGQISGNVKDKNNVQKGTILVPEDDMAVIYYQVSAGNTVYLEGTPATNHAFVEWEVSDEDVVSGKDLTKSPLTFTMPSKDIRVKGDFDKLYKVTYKVENATHGKITGTAEQFIVRGGSTTSVTATPNDKYAFNYWKEDGSKVATRSDDNITSDTTYTAVFTNLWTVTFHNEDGTVFKQIIVRDGESGEISEFPEKYEYKLDGIVKDKYVPGGWWKDLSYTQKADLSNIKANTSVYAKLIPRISITDEQAKENKYVSAHIVGTMITEGTLQYIISDSQTETGEIYFKYELEGATIGDWYNVDNLYRSKEALETKNDSSSYLILTSPNEKETVVFNYILSSTTDSQLGITINGERVIGPNDNSSSWKEFSKEVDVINGQIKIGLSYSKGANAVSGTDYAAIKNLYLSRQWTIISNDYYLYVPAEYKNNYIHVKGTGSDDGEIYRKVSELITVNLECDHAYTSWKFIDVSQHKATCTLCGEEKIGYHNTNGGWYYNSTSHWRACTVCWNQGEATSPHTAGSRWHASSESGHWQTCTACGITMNKGAHTTQKPCQVCYFTSY